MNALKAWLLERGLAEGQANVTAALLAVGLLLLLSFVAYLVAKRILLRLVSVAARRTKTTWDDAFVEARLFSRFAHLVPALILQAAAPVALVDYPAAVTAVVTATSVYLALVG